MRWVSLPAASRADTFSRCTPSASAVVGRRLSWNAMPSSVARWAVTPFESVMSAVSSGRLVCAVDGAWTSIPGAVASTRSAAVEPATLPARSRAVTESCDEPSATGRLTAKLPSAAARARAEAVPARTSISEPASVRPRSLSVSERSQPFGTPAMRRLGRLVSTLIVQLRRM